MAIILWFGGVFNSQSFLLLELVLSPFGSRVVVGLTCLLEEEVATFNDVTYSGGGNTFDTQKLTVLIQIQPDLFFTSSGVFFSDSLNEVNDPGVCLGCPDGMGSGGDGDEGR